jgi:uncharacterized damage-inducible protein DinB
MSRASRWMSAVVLGAGLIASASAGRADDVSSERAAMIASISDAGGKLVELAGAIPEKKYSWRPEKGVRSVAEVLRHVTAANYGLPMFIGVAPPAGAPVTKENFATFDKTPADKATIVAQLKASFDYAKQVIAQVPDSELDSPVDLFGAKNTKRGTLYILVNHAHEHLGQSIAYARSNAITPPWTAREEAAAKEKAKGGK